MGSWAWSLHNFKTFLFILLLLFLFLLQRISFTVLELCQLRLLWLLCCFALNLFYRLSRYLLLFVDCISGALSFSCFLFVWIWTQIILSSFEIVSLRKVMIFWGYLEEYVLFFLKILGVLSIDIFCDVIKELLKLQELYFFFFLIFSIFIAGFRLTIEF